MKLVVAALSFGVVNAVRTTTGEKATAKKMAKRAAIGLMTMAGAMVGGANGQTGDLKTNFDLANSYRASRGLSALRWESGLATLANQHAQDQAAVRQNPANHANWDQRIRTHANCRNGCQATENVYLKGGGVNTPEHAHNAWVNSPGHEANMRGNYTHMGVGTATNYDGQNRHYWVQIYMWI